jgi:hypothetical protein
MNEFRYQSRFGFRVEVIKARQAQSFSSVGSSAFEALANGLN